MNENLTTVIIADDHDIFRLGLKLMIEEMPGYRVVTEVSNGEEAIAAIRTNPPTIAILDYAMPGRNGIDVIDEIRQRNLPTKTILLTAVQSEAILSEALSSGANGLCLKEDAYQEIKTAIDAVSKGERFISAGAEPLTERGGALAILTRRERQVLILVAGGKRNREIADDLNLSIKTVDSHRTSAMKKLRLHSVAELVDFANRCGLLQS